MPEPLRNDVRVLGEFLGRVLREAGGDDLLADVEHLRELAIRAHNGPDAEALAQAEELVAGLQPRPCRRGRARVHVLLPPGQHSRRSSTACASCGSARPTSCRTTWHRTTRCPRRSRSWPTRWAEDVARQRLAELEFRPVLTAHPTEARRRAVSGSIRRIAELVAERDPRHTGGMSLAENDRRLLAEIDTLWRTAPLREAKPSVLDEVRTVISVFDATLADVLPARLPPPRRLAAGRRRRHHALRPCGRSRGSGPGSAATATATRTSPPRSPRPAAAIASEHALLELECLGPQDRARAHPRRVRHPALGRAGRAVAAAAAACPRRWPRRIAGDAPNEPHRRVVYFLAERIAATRTRNADLGLRRRRRSCEADLARRAALAGEAGATRSAYGDLQWLDLAGADLRVPPRRARGAAALPGARGRARRPREERHRRRPGAAHGRGARHLPRHRRRPAPLRRARRPPLHRVVHAVRRAPRRRVPAGRDRVRRAWTRPVIDAIPLFETFADLEASVDILEGALALPQVQRRLAENGRRVEVMLGYSDSSKDVGPGLRHAHARRRAAPHHGVGASQRHRAHPLPRPRRCPGSRWRPRQPGAARAAPGVGRRPVQAHRAGRGHLRPLRRPGDRRPPHRAGRRGDAAGRRRRRSSAATPRPPSGSPRSPRSSTSRRAPGSTSWSRPRASRSGSPRSPRSRRSACCRSARVPRAAGCRSSRSTTCARSRGCSAGRRRGSTWPAGTAWAPRWRRPTTWTSCARRTPSGRCSPR